MGLDHELQCHLAEYNALRSETLELIKWRDSLVFISLGICGAIFSFQFSKDISSGVSIKDGGFYVITPLATLIGGLWMVNTLRINRIGIYLGQVLAKKIEVLLSESKSETFSKKISIFEWQTSNARLKYKWHRRITEWLLYVSTFVMPGVLAQFLIYSNSKNIINGQTLHLLKFREVFYINWMLIFVCSLLFIYYLLRGFSQKKKKVLELID